MIDYDGRVFRADGPRPESERTVGHYYQNGDRLWGNFAGGSVVRGFLVGRQMPDGILDFTYCQLLTDGVSVSGHCRSVPELLSDGRVRLHEDWQRFDEAGSRGVSVIEEIERTP